MRGNRRQLHGVEIDRDASGGGSLFDFSEDSKCVGELSPKPRPHAHANESEIYQRTRIKFALFVEPRESADVLGVGSPAACQQQVYIQQKTHGKSASAAFTKSEVIAGAPGGATRTGFPFSRTRVAEVESPPYSFMVK